MLHSPALCNIFILLNVHKQETVNEYFVTMNFTIFALICSLNY